MIFHNTTTTKELKSLVRKGTINFGGNRKLRIYGTLHCGSGKRMKRENRVFFANEKEGLENGYRPCKKCMRQVLSKIRVDSNLCLK